MLPDLYLPMVLPGGRAGGLVARDVCAAIFFADWPGPHANPEHLELWHDRMLSRVTLSPVSSMATLLHLGDARYDAVAAYCHAVGWPTREPTRPALVAEGDWTQHAVALDYAVLNAAPHPILAQRLDELAREYHLDPARLWFGPVSRFLWVLRMRQQAQGPTLAKTGIMALPEELRHIGLAEEPGA